MLVEVLQNRFCAHKTAKPCAQKKANFSHSYVIRKCDSVKFDELKIDMD